jgi:hypothetical protein
MARVAGVRADLIMDADELACEVVQRAIKHRAEVRRKIETA